MTNKSGKKSGGGYGKPPTAARFKKGQSGNPAGRPRGSKSLMTHLGDTLAEKIQVREGDKVRVMSKGKAVAAKLVNGGLRTGSTITETILCPPIHKTASNTDFADSIIVEAVLKGEMGALRKLVDLSPAIDEQKSAGSDLVDDELDPRQIEMLEAYLQRLKA